MPQYSCVTGLNPRKPCAGAKNPRDRPQGMLWPRTYIRAFEPFSSRCGRRAVGRIFAQSWAEYAMPAKTRFNKVLLVDGDLRTSQRLAKLLREDGFEVEVLRDGATAIARLTRAPLPDVLITELKLPLCDGSAVVRFGRSQHAGMSVVVLTGYPNLLAAEEFGGPTPVLLTKPLDYPALLDVLNGRDFSGHDRSAPTSARRSA
jgi:CheY-like chemotaxis protein